MTSTSEQQLVLRQASEDYPLSAVPADARKSIWSMAFMLLGYGIFAAIVFYFVLSKFSKEKTTS